MCGLLSDLGAEVVAADSGTDALRRVLRRDFCAILMDVRMPQLDGYETAALIRQRERSRHIPIIFLTAYDKDEAPVFRGDRTSVVSGKSVSVRVDHGGRRIITKKTTGKYMKKTKTETY